MARHRKPNDFRSGPIKAIQPSPSIIHYVLASANKASPNRGQEESEDGEGALDAIAATVAQASPELVVFSTCLSGRRLAPLAISRGAHLAIGFHGWVMDASCPAFFGAFYQAWLQEGASPLSALRQALAANKSQPNPDDLGVVTLWSSSDLMAVQPLRLQPAGPARAGKGKGKAKLGRDGDSGIPSLAQVLPVDCELEQSLNYSMLHNKSGGIFKRFYVTKLVPVKMDDLEVIVKFDNGIERAAECRFFVPLREEANSVEKLDPRVMLPLGSELLRRRGEMIRGTMEILIKCGQSLVFHRYDSIELPPCDEWKDDEAGRRFLPSFIFPRDPAVRDILTAAQPFLRALTDDPIAGFDGYQSAFVGDGVEAVRRQLRAIWTALQTTYRLDYVNPPPSYIGGVQRLRTPEEVLRARRGTCIELASPDTSIVGCASLSLPGIVSISRARMSTEQPCFPGAPSRSGSPAGSSSEPGAAACGARVRLNCSTPWMVTWSAYTTRSRSPATLTTPSIESDPCASTMGRTPTTTVSLPVTVCWT